MHRVFTYLIVIAACVLNSATAQTNLNFENWTGNEPNGWASSNAITTPSGGAQTVVIETANPGQGSASVKMVTGSCPECPNFSILGSFGPPTPLPDPLGGSIQLGSFAGTGVPYSQRPISVDFKFKANPVGNDAGGFWVELTKYDPVNDETETIGEGYFEASSQVSSWTNMNIPIVYYSGLTPDTINIWATSSIGSIPDLSIFGIPTPPGLPTPVAGSEFYLDEIVFNLPSCAGFSLAVTGTNETTLGANDGTASANASGGTPPYTYAWSNLSTSQSINGLIPGYYNVTVTDANQCQKVGSYYVAPGGCNISVSVSGTNSSINSIYTGTGTATATASGGNPPYDYQWNTGATTSTISNLAIGTYSVLVVEQNNPNCAVWGYFTVFGPGGTSGIDKNNLQDKISFYPNPFSTQATVKSEIPLHNATLTVKNSFGQNVKQLSVINGQTATFNRDGLPAGLYFVQISQDNKVIANKKFVITD